MEKDHETGQVGRVEDHDDVLDIGAILLDILAEILGDLAVALEEVLTGHAFLAGCTTGRDDVLGVLESLGGIGRPGDVGTFESAVRHLGDNATQTGLIHIIQAHVGGETQHQRGLGHVGADHTSGTDNDQFFVS